MKWTGLNWSELRLWYDIWNNMMIEIEIELKLAIAITHWIPFKGKLHNFGFYHIVFWNLFWMKFLYKLGPALEEP